VADLKKLHKAASLAQEAASNPAGLAIRAGKITRAELLEFLRQQYRLEFNELKRVSEIDGNPLGDAAHLGDVFLADQHGIETTKQAAVDCIEYVSKVNPYNPIKRYLEGLRSHPTGLRLISMKELAEAFAIAPEDKLSQRLLACHLAGAAKRGLEPGYKHDQVLIFCGEQGKNKSGAIQELASPNWYDSATRVEDLESKDFLAKVNGCWLFEIEECEHALLKRTASEFKSFVTRLNDCYVEKYEREAKTHYRRSVLFGTTNQSEFLNDNTGNRRAWVIFTSDRSLNPKWIAEHRDSIWATVLTWIDWGLRNYVPIGDSLTTEAAERAQEANLSDPWEGELIKVLNCRPADSNGGIAQDELIRQALHLDIDRIDRNVQMRVTRTVTGSSFRTHNETVAWRSCKRRWNGGVPRSGYEPVQIKGVPSVPTAVRPAEGVGTEVGSAQKPWCNSALTTLFQPVPTFTSRVSRETGSSADNDATPLHPISWNRSERPQKAAQEGDLGVPSSYQALEHQVGTTVQSELELEGLSTAARAESRVGSAWDSDSA
jgi:predicted P-loop ATPase